jgi:thiamine-phosphate pyrophosphorylase
MREASSKRAVECSQTAGVEDADDGFSVAVPPKNYHRRTGEGRERLYTGAVLRYAITDRRLLAPECLAQDAEGQARPIERLAARCGLLAGRGIDLLQLREKDLPEVGLIELGQAILSEVRRRNAHTRLLVNASSRIALSIGADGVHLTSTSNETPIEVAALFAEAGMPAPWVSVSCHTEAEVRRARETGATHILFGPVFEKSVRGERIRDGAGLEALREACHAAGPVPVLALGGVTEGNAAVCVEAGAAGIAGIRLFMNESGCVIP